MIYAYVHMTLSNKDALAAYREKAAQALAKHDGQVVGASPTPTLLEGAFDQPDLAAILSFPDRDGAIAWIEDPALQEVHALRRASGASAILLVG